MNEQVLGNEAKQILEMPAFRLAIDALERSYIDKWKNSTANAQDERERAWVSISVLDDIVRELKVLVDNATVETTKKARQTRKKAS